MDNNLSDKINRTNREKFPELYRIEPKKTNQFAFLKSCPYRRSFFHYYSNPIIGYKHILDPSHPKGLPKKTLDIPRAKSVKKEFRGCFPEMRGTIKGKSYNKCLAR